MKNGPTRKASSVSVSCSEVSRHFHMRLEVCPASDFSFLQWLSPEEKLYSPWGAGVPVSLVFAVILTSSLLGANKSF